MRWIVPILPPQLGFPGCDPKASDSLILRNSLHSRFEASTFCNDTDGVDAAAERRYSGPVLVVDGVERSDEHDHVDCAAAGKILQTW